MRKKLVIIGAVVLIIGVVLFFAVSEELLATSNVGQIQTGAGSGEWKSPMLNVTSGGQVTLISSSASSALIPASDLSKVTSSNLASYALKTSSGFKNLSVGTVSVYMPPAGSYYIVTFSSTAPTLTYTVVNSASLTVVLGLLEIVAIVMGIAGLIVLIVGAVLKEKHREDPLNLYN